MYPRIFRGYGESTPSAYSYDVLRTQFFPFALLLSIADTSGYIMLTICMCFETSNNPGVDSMETDALERNPEIIDLVANGRANTSDYYQDGEQVPLDRRGFRASGESGRKPPLQLDSDINRTVSSSYPQWAIDVGQTTRCCIRLSTWRDTFDGQLTTGSELRFVWVQSEPLVAT
ncbi:hypothetical protein H112_06764 [Trichophyton rubrum D6]|uniref:Uncharacterized protein n=3 Tax=Trichophyton TaxID=5550 RepID=A0A080WRI8_TRIRC|nr:uncharacterized protein TERG_11804 [Trichophyton rubrum CBS 118892]EZF12135.1 hypothetical protein H100_06786 [Trichophyton rubrum MR850]EZF38992.1 hypothetical protein H102_06747 [Trichophyton rubrum CBS 100081]EZF49707.1 hypothetical protein H103_06771 [Trichophyton rubrum CBS 288.86]EZF60270.1 hypothetical protein H104_06726 [Trichophyton rubrum CBS 289.86]EZF70868.1 hypothetical protein H105_06787 [Trichophyton soudanense CBS 452.61]EZF81640.1 hypothetical protein H110_06768 [Trichophy